MKILHSNQEGSWYIIKKVELTKEQENILATGTDEEKQVVGNYIKANSTKLATKKDSDAAIALYNANKPKGDIFLLHASVDLDDETGFINYRINDEHKQCSFPNI
jgi:hypothetical protein